MNEAEKKNLQLVKVYVRQRPFTKNESELRRPNIVNKMTSKEISIRSGAQEKNYSFDGVFGISTPQEEVYDTVVNPLIHYVLSGYSCTVFAYGQTGSGKTYTMIGEHTASNLDLNNPSMGMIPRSAVHLFSELHKLNLDYAVKVSFVEIYNEEIRDLLVSDGVPLSVYDDPENKGATWIKDVTEHPVKNCYEVHNLLNRGVEERHTASTNLNRNSSRSHTIFTIVVSTRETTSQGEQIIKTGKLHLIDLAGSENIGRSGATEMRAREAGTINKSLLTLGKVIKALASKMQHIPYRESKLTRILQDSLGGKSKTCMIATFSPTRDYFEETASTLDYAKVARSVANCPTVNINRNPTTVLKDANEELTQLRLELKAARAGEGFYMLSSIYENMTQEIRAKNERVAHLLREIQYREEHIRQSQQHYDELNESFERAKKNVEAVTTELREEEEQVKQNEFVAKYLDEEKIKIKDTASELLDVCKTSTKNEEIYHTKYEKQIHSTLHNANVAKNYYFVTSHYLRSIENTSDVHTKQQEARATAAIKGVRLIKENHAANLQELNLLSAKMKEKSEGHNLTFDNIFKDESYNAEQLHSQFTALFKHGCEVQLQRVRDTKTSVGTVRDYIHEESANMEEKMKECTRAIDEQFIREKENRAIAENLLGDLYSTLIEEQGYLKQKRSFIKIKKDMCLCLLEQITAENEETKKELATLRNTKKLIEQIRLTMNENMLKPLQNTRELVARFKRSVERMRLIPPVIQKCIDTVKIINTTCQQEIEADEKEAHEYSSKFFDLSSENIEHINKEMQDTLMQWAKDLKMIQSSLTRTTLENCDNVCNQIDATWNATLEYLAALKAIIQKSSKMTQNMKKDVEVQIHAGDTPVKPEYKYPKSIETDDLSIEDLQRQFERLPKDSPLNH